MSVKKPGKRVERRAGKSERYAVSRVSAQAGEELSARLGQEEIQAEWRRLDDERKRLLEGLRSDEAAKGLGLANKDEVSLALFGIDVAKKFVEARKTVYYDERSAQYYLCELNEFLFTASEKVRGNEIKESYIQTFTAKVEEEVAWLKKEQRKTKDGAKRERMRKLLELYRKFPEGPYEMRVGDQTLVE